MNITGQGVASPDYIANKTVESCCSLILKYWESNFFNFASFVVNVVSWIGLVMLFVMVRLTSLVIVTLAICVIIIIKFIGKKLLKS